MNRILILSGGALNLLMAAFHSAFPFLFAWKDDLAALSSVNQAIFYTLHGAVILVMLWFAVISFIFSAKLILTSLGRAVCLLVAAVWLLRSIAEVIWFRLGVDGAWWRLAVFLLIAGLYLIPATFTRGE